VSGLLGNIGVRVALIAIFVVGAFIFRDRLSGAANDLRVGDCFEEPGAAVESISDVQHQPCTDPHDNEVILVADHPAEDGAAVPSDPEYERFAIERCGPAFNSYTGSNWETDQVINWAFYVPADDAWREGNRKLICYAFRLDEARLSQSLKSN
jgi:hypothetical protein